MAAQSRYRCAATLRGHTGRARRRRPVEPRVDCSSTPRGAQVYCVAALPNGRVVSGGWESDGTHKVWDASTGECLRTLTRHTDWARRRRPVEPRVDRWSTPRGAQVLCVAALPSGRVVSGSCGAFGGVGMWDVSTGKYLCTLRGHTDRARRRRPVEPRSIARRRRDGRRSLASPSCRTAASCPGRPTARSRCGTRRALSASSR